MQEDRAAKKVGQRSGKKKKKITGEPITGTNSSTSRALSFKLLW